MPIVFLLHRTSLEFAYGANRLSPWLRIVQDEELLLDRARSMFATQWFGAHFPLNGFSLRIAIENIAALRQRYAAVQAPAPSRIDLSVPLGALIGTAVGSLANPVNMIAFAIFAAIEGLWKVLFYALAMIFAPAAGLLSGAVGIALAPSLLIVDWLGASGPVGLLVVLGDFVSALTTFLAAVDANWDAIVGNLVILADLILGYLNGLPKLPDDPSRGVEWWKSLLNALLPVIEQAAILLPMLTGAITLIIFAGGPIMKRLAVVLPPFLAFVDAAIEALIALLDDFFDALKLAVKMPSDRLQEALWWATFWIVVAGLWVSTLIDKYVAFLKSRGPALKAAFSAWRNRVTKDLRTVFNTHPLVRMMNNLINAIGNGIDAMKAGFWSGVKTEGTVLGGPLGGRIADTIHEKLAAWWDKPSDPFVPEFKLPDAGAIFARLEQPTAWGRLAYSPDIGPMPTIPAALVKPIGVFGGMRQELKAELKQDPATALASAHAEERRLRGFIFDVVARHLPAAAQAKFDKLRGVLQSLDHTLSPLEPESAQRVHPVRALPEDPQVLPAVGRLTVRARGISEGELRRWLPVLREALGQQPYLKVI